MSSAMMTMAFPRRRMSSPKQSGNVRRNCGSSPKAWYSPIWPDGTQHSRNVYARTREECEEKLKALIAEMNEERKNLKEQLAGIAPPEKLTKKQRKLWDYMRLHPEVTEFSTIAKRTGLARNTVKKHYGMVAAMLGRA